MSRDDPFAREKLADVLARLPAYGRLAWRLARDPLVSKARRAALIAAAGYLVSPIDAVPGVIPVLGQLDDLAVALGAIRIALAGLSPTQRQAHLAAVGLDDRTLGGDIRVVAATMAWTIRAGVRTAAATVRVGIRLGVRGSRTALRGAKAGVRGARVGLRAIRRRR